MGPLQSVQHALTPASGDFTDAWLANRRLSAHTRAAYRRDVHQFLGWCAGRDLDPLRVSFLHVNAYARELESTVDARTGRVLDLEAHPTLIPRTTTTSTTQQSPPRTTGFA